MEYEYLKLVVSSLHIILIMMSLYTIYLYSKNIIIDKAPKDGTLLSIFDYKEIEEIGFYIFIIIFNISLLLNFYEIISVYTYKIIFMIICIGLIFIIIRKYKEVK